MRRNITFCFIFSCILLSGCSHLFHIKFSTFNVLLVNASNEKLHNVKIGVPPKVIIERPDKTIKPEEKTIILQGMSVEVEGNHSIRLCGIPYGGLGEFISVEWERMSGKTYKKTVSLRDYEMDLIDNTLIIIIDSDNDLLISHISLDK